MLRIIVTIVVVAVLVAMWAITRMIVNGLKAGDGLLNPSVVNARYNSRNLWIFGACIAAGIVAVIVLNLLFLMGYITDLHIY